MARSNESIHLYLSDREQQVLVDVAEYGNGLATRTRPAPEIGRVNKGSAVSHHGKRSGPAENLANSDEGGRQGFFGVLERSFVWRGTTGTERRFPVKRLLAGLRRPPSALDYRLFQPPAVDNLS
jgi:hypothetical protein